MLHIQGQVMYFTLALVKYITWPCIKAHVLRFNGGSHNGPSAA